MIYLSLPLFYNNFTFNNVLINFLKNNPESKKFSFVIESTYGSYPYVSWNGDINSNYGELALNRDFYNCPDRSNCVLKYDFSNVFLNKKDFYDIHSNTILKECDNGSNQIEISNLNLLDYLMEKYPNYSYCFSKNADLINPLNEEIINLISEKNLFLLINLPTYFNRKKELLAKINNKSKIELTICSRCTCDEEQIKQCLIQENKNQIDFSGCSIYQNCKKINYYKNYNQIENEIKELNKLGYTHFKIDSPPVGLTKEFNLFLIYSLIKPEYIFEFLTISKGLY